MSSLVSLCQVIALLVLFYFGVSLAGKDIPANFVFGDSLVEVGNNNYLATLAKANNFPNGIDFGSPTGRFTNGRTIVDIICKYSSYKKVNNSTSNRLNLIHTSFLAMFQAVIIKIVFNVKILLYTDR